MRDESVQSDTASAQRRMDYGRLAFVPVMSLLFAAGVFRVFKVLIDHDGSLAVVSARTVRALLILAFYALLIRFYLIRGRPSRTTQSKVAHVAAVVATFLPFTLPALSSPTDSLPALIASGVLISAGVAWSVWALRHLGRSISLVAQARELVRSGPYAIVRHPLYVGELLASAGVVLAGPTLAAAGVMIVYVCLQVYRAVHEEALLSQSFAEYDEYAARTARFLPGIV